VEFLVEFELNVPEGAPQSEVQDRKNAEAAAAAKLADEGHLVRLWTVRVGPDQTRALGLYRADSESELDALLRALPLSDWMDVIITALGQHPNDPATARATG
jgi:muconolactone D-isomerase